MMITERVARLLHQQVGHELGASQEYLATAVYFAQSGLDGWADFFYKQSEEERGHAMKIVRFLVDTGVTFTFPAIREADPQAVTSPLDAVQKALKWEQSVTEQFKTMSRTAREDGDPITEHFLQWFLMEQIEEESSMDKLVKMLQSGLNPFQADKLLAREEDEG